MKKLPTIVIALLLFLVVCVVIYLVISFIMWDFPTFNDIIDVTPIERIALLFLTILIFLGVIQVLES